MGAPAQRRETHTGLQVIFRGPVARRPEVLRTNQADGVTGQGRRNRSAGRLEPGEGAGARAGRGSAVRPSSGRKKRSSSRAPKII